MKENEECKTCGEVLIDPHCCKTKENNGAHKVSMSLDVNEAALDPSSFLNCDADIHSSIFTENVAVES